MGIRERKQRRKDHTRSSIVSAALKIGKEEGWGALSIRKIGDVIEYSAPVIYEYFQNKNALLLELTRIGYNRLTRDIKAVREMYDNPALQLEAIWLVYWKFAFTEKEFYQLMFGIEISCTCQGSQLPEAQQPEVLIRDVIRELVQDDANAADKISSIYYTFWSIVHGLISLNMIGLAVSGAINDKVLRTSLSLIIDSITMA